MKNKKRIFKGCAKAMNICVAIGLRKTQPSPILLLLYCLKGLFALIILSQAAFAADCNNNWLRPSSQTMETEDMAASLTEYASIERHFFIRQGNKSIDVYYLRGALLVKGPPADKIESYSRETIWWLPMVFVVPATVLSEAVPKGPCHVDRKITFSFKLSGALGYGRHKLTHAEGEVVPTSANEIAYKFTVTTDPPTKDGKVIRYTGTMKLSPPEAALREDINVKGYTVAGRRSPFLVIGSSELPVTMLGELRRALVEKKKAPKHGAGAEKEIVMAPEVIEGMDTIKEIYPFKIGGERGLTGFVDKKGQVIVEPQFFLIMDFHDDIAVFKNNKLKAGYINRAGKVIVEPQYWFHEYTDFSEGLAAVKTNNKWGFIDKTGQFVIEPKFSFYAYINPMPSFSEGLAAMQKDRKWGFIDKTGKFVIEPQFEWACHFCEGLAAVEKNKKWGFINKKGAFVIEPQYDVTPARPFFSEGLAAMKKDGKWGFIDKTGKITIESQFESVQSFHGGIAVVKINGQWSYIDKTGRFIIKQQFERAESFYDGIARVKMNEKWGYIDRIGRIIVEPRFEYKHTRDFCEGLAAVNKDGKWGYIDKTGQFIIEPQFEGAVRFKDGIAGVEKNGQWGLIDKSGQIFVINDTVCGQDVVKNSKGQITWPKNIKEICR